MKDYRHVFDLKFLKLILDIVEIVDYLTICYIKIMIELII